MASSVESTLRKVERAAVVGARVSCRNLPARLSEMRVVVRVWEPWPLVVVVVVVAVTMGIVGMFAC